MFFQLNYIFAKISTFFLWQILQKNEKSAILKFTFLCLPLSHCIIFTLFAFYGNLQFWPLSITTLSYPTPCNAWSKSLSRVRLSCSAGVVRLFNCNLCQINASPAIYHLVSAILVFKHQKKLKPSKPKLRSKLFCSELSQKTTFLLQHN
jgi:hypothetical protein